MISRKSPQVNAGIEYTCMAHVQFANLIQSPSRLAVYVDSTAETEPLSNLIINHSMLLNTSQFVIIPFV
jgi:hypothetical protein